MSIRRALKRWLYWHVETAREPDLYIGGREEPYLLRWYVIPRNPIFNVYYHIFLRSDYAEALHDHPWAFNASLLLDGSYTEYVFKPSNEITDHDEVQAEYDGKRPTKALERKEGAFYFRLGRAPHRVQLHQGPSFDAIMRSRSQEELDAAQTAAEQPCTTLFITGPKVRKWGFYCPKGWKPWFKFLDKYESAHESVEAEGCD